MTKLSEISEAIVDCEHKTAPTATEGYPSIRTTDIKNGRLLIHQANRVSEDTYHEWSRRRRPQPGDIILAREAPVGEVGIVPPGENVCLGQRTVLISPDRTAVDPQYLVYLLVSPGVRHEMDARAAGSTVPHLNMSDIRALELPALPSLEDQSAIGACLGALDEKIELNRRLNERLERSARAIFRDWFVDFGPTRAKAEGREPYLVPELWQLFPETLDDEDKPVGWKAGTLSEVAESPRRGVKPAEVSPETPYIGLEHMPRRSIALTEWEGAGKVTSTKSRFERGEILFGKLRPYFHKVGIAPNDGICSTDIVVIVPKSERWGAFVLACVSSDEFVGYTDRTSTGTKMPRTSWKTMARYEMCLPPKEVVDAFQNVIGPAVEKILANTEETRALAAIRDLLLPKLMSGEIRVKDAEKAVEAVA